MHSDRPGPPILTRRRLLAAAGATLLHPGVAWAQQPPLLPLPPFLQPRPIEPAPPGAELAPGLTAPAKPEPKQITEEDWFLDSVPDGSFEIRKVNFELLDPEFRRQLVPYPGNEQPGTIVVDPKNHFLYTVREGGQAVRYGVGVGREGFGWNGAASVGRKAEWPDWVPPKEMRLRQPELPERVAGGPSNPLGARALYLYQGNRDTLYRIHGTFEPWTIGTNVSSGCIRMLNEEVADLYLRTPIGTRVVVL
ncbi:MAG: L,D-transpeptidase [Bradyrhizobiaceae bacterium]|nr:L,D-transpeptidase [Bradyrhizobiaceae bacterium]